MSTLDLSNKAAPGVPYYTPEQQPAAGTALDKESVPTLFKPYRMRGVELHNRFVVSPMCQYSADNGHLTDYHFVHVGQFALRGAGLIMVEATAVEARGRITPHDSGLWTDSQIAPLKRITDFVHSQGTKIGIELAHAGRKATTLAPWLSEVSKKQLATRDVGGWPDDVVAPSAIPLSEDYAQPKAMTIDEIKNLSKQFADAAVRAVRAGFDLIEIHGGHGYLINEFLSPISNKRTDKYGGSFENRIRVLEEVIAAVREVIPVDMPLWVRISATEWMEWNNEPSWDIQESIRLAKLLPGLGVDALDVSSGGNNAQQRIQFHPRYQTDLAGQIKAAVQEQGLILTIAAVGAITETEMARSLVDDNNEPHADLVVAARQFLRNPEWVLRSAHELGVNVKWPHQYERAQRSLATKF
ncbi:oxidoreductase [Trichoderma harzianum]|uniref:Oxidoreductase n=1 Tax=Trichoderma harzianum TaxID=5544 RepID=A0A0F9X9R2_TRIHA|nr:oxidoreductase [Trichoderma harzianum]